MRHRRRSVANLSILAFALALLVPAGGGVNAADDSVLFTNVQAPNVLLLMDSSGSMNGIMYHKAWPGGGSATCDVIPSGFSGSGDIFDDASRPILARCAGSGCRLEVRSSSTDFVATPGLLGSSKSGYVERTFCGQTRKIFHDGNVEDRGGDTDYSRWFDPYIDWYFSLDASDVTTTYGPDAQTAAEILAEVDSDTNGTNYITGATFPLYKRARITAATDVAEEVMYRMNSKCAAFGGDCGVYQNNIRFGLAQFAPGSHGGYVSVDIADYTGNKSLLESELAAVDPSGSTPLGEALFKLYTYFMSRTSGERPKGKNTTTEFPQYDYRLSNGDGDALSTDATSDPVDLECRKNFIIVLTDGEPGSDNFATSGNDTDGFGSFKSSLIGDYAADAAGDADIGTDSTPEEGPPWIDGAGAGYLDDIALFMQQNDLRPVDFPNSFQTVDVYTIGFGVTGDAVESLLQKTANNGNGIYRQGNQSDQLVDALIESLSHIIEKTQSFAAATVPASRSTDGNNFFTAYFRPSGDVPYWEGHLKLFDIDVTGRILDAPSPTGTGQCALNDPDATRCRIGGLNLGLTGFWDAGKVVPGASSRALYVSDYPSAPPSTVPVLPAEFTDLGAGRMTAADLGIAGATSSDIGTYDIGFAGHDTTGITTDEGLADAVVRYVRGCEFKDGSCTDRGPFSKLFDIFHSSPLVVGPPNAGLRARSYRDFVLQYKHRKRVIYAGTNGGFVHGFNTGEWDGSATPPAYDRGTGVEEFGFMAYPARENIAMLPKDTFPRGVGSWNGYTMDGSPSAADVWFYPNPDDHPDDTDLTLQTWEYWRTVLVGGMRQGGRVVWALDVTDPDAVSGAPSMYPGYLWEFPCEASSCDAWRPYMGETWSQPVITRVRVTVDCGNASSSSGCPVYDRWVAIFGAGYDQAGDPNMVTHEADPANLNPGEYDASSESGTSRAGRAIFMVDVTNGEVLAAKRYDDAGTAGDSSDGEPGMRFALASAPAAFDVDFDGYTDAVYIGDLGGNVWKWVFDEPGQDHLNGSEGTDHQARWPFLKILAAENCTSCSPKHYKSFYSPPTGALVGPDLWLAIGSGERNDLLFGRDGGLSTAEKNRFYVFKDRDPLEIERDPATLPYTDVSPSIDFIDGTAIATFNPNSCLSGGHVGFYFEGDQGEKFITDSIIFFGVVFTGSYVPSPSSADTCDATGDAFLYGFDLLCGEGSFPPASGDPNDPNERRIKVGEGLPSSPRVSVGPTDEGPGDPNDPNDPCKDMVIVITSDNGGYSDGRCERTSSGLGLQTWRDR
jgi:hypothetical protein